ncbi:(Fe-S)-binding protein [Alphaproteobacteria bacterium]|nr:(Fe-S)-binding protein [Alphaproteobacteria bacterium]
MHDKIVEVVKNSIFEYENKNENMWKEPLVEVMSAHDSQLSWLKKAVSPNHLLPSDVLPDAKSVIVYFIPFRKKIIKSNIKGDLSSKEWALAYIKTNDLIKNTNENIELFLSQTGHAVGKIAPTHNFNTETLISDWSHRHIAYIAGLGTFGINNMLITKKGCCGRFGSIVTNYEFKYYKDITERKERCLNKINGSCGKCRKQCPVKAYKNKVFDRNKCYAKCMENMEYYKSLGYADACGKCLVGLPCSTEDPSE